MLVEPVVPATEPVSLGELKAYLRIDGADEDAVLAGLLRAARSLCEAFTRQWLIQRGAVETVPARRDPGARLTGSPVGAVTVVEGLYDDGTTSVLSPDRFALTLDADGVARLASRDPAATRLRATYTAGGASDWNGVPEPLRQGIIRLAAHLYANRDAPDEPGPPAVVAALWHPFRRLRLG